MCKAAGKESAMKQDTLTGAADKQPLVSVIMPAYNAEKYIGEAIASVCAQTYENWELLILDDGSADRTVEIAESYAQQDVRIQVLRNPQNMGVARTRNRGFDLAQGEWIALLDSDDRWRAQKLEKQLAVARSSDADIVYCSYAMIDENGCHLSDFIVPETTSYRAMLEESVLSCSTVLIRRDALRDHRFCAQYYHEDYALWLELMRSGFRTLASRETLADYRVAKGSRSSDKLKSARYRWRIYRDVERLSLPRSACAFFSYALHGVRKHGRI